MKIVVLDRAGALREAAAKIAAVLAAKPDAVLAFSSEAGEAGLFDALAALAAAGALRLDRARLFAVEEYAEVRAEQSCRRALEEGLLRRTDARAENCRFLTETGLDGYDTMIQQTGGLDLAVLAMGSNGRLGFNEPATPFDSGSHRQKLTDATRRQLAARFGGEEQTPAYGLTLGIRPIVQARESLLLALGEETAEAAYRTVYGKTESYTPASFLQVPAEVTLLLDRAAAHKLS